MMQPNDFVTHICLIGDDPTANLTPIVDKNIASHRLVIVHTSGQQQSVDALTRIVKIRAHQVDTWLLPNTLSTEKIKLSLIRLFEQEINQMSDPNLNQSILLNASNGKRHHILSAYEIARSYKIPIFVIEPAQDTLCWLYPEDRGLTEISDRIKLHEFFHLNECELVSQKNKLGISKTLRELGEQWLSKSDKLHSGLAKLNYLAMIAKGQQPTAKQDDAMLSDESLQWLLESLERNKLLKLDGKLVRFLNNDIRFFCNGGWLEETTFSYIRGLRSEIQTIQDDGHSVEIERLVKGKKLLNELDVVALVNNKLYVIECKTKRYERGDGSNTLYKLDSLTDRLGSIKAKAALVTFFPLTKTERRRAVELDIKVISFEELPRLRESLKRWLS